MYLDITAMSFTGGGSSVKWKNDTHCAWSWFRKRTNIVRKTNRTKIIFDVYSNTKRKKIKRLNTSNAGFIEIRVAPVGCSVTSSYYCLRIVIMTFSTEVVFRRCSSNKDKTRAHKFNNTCAVVTSQCHRLLSVRVCFYIDNGVYHCSSRCVVFVSSFVISYDAVQHNTVWYRYINDRSCGFLSNRQHFPHPDRCQHTTQTAR